MTCEDRGHATGDERHDNNKREKLTSRRELDRRVVLLILARYPMCRLLLGEFENAIGETRMDLLVFRELVGRWVWGAPEANRLDYLAGNDSAVKTALVIDELAVNHRLVLWLRALFIRRGACPCGHVLTASGAACIGRAVELLRRLCALAIAARRKRRKCATRTASESPHDLSRIPSDAVIRYEERSTVGTQKVAIEHEPARQVERRTRADDASKSPRAPRYRSDLKSRIGHELILVTSCRRRIVCGGGLRFNLVCPQRRRTRAQQGRGRKCGDGLGPDYRSRSY